MENSDEEEDIFNFKGSRENVFAQTWKKFKEALLGTLFVMGEEPGCGHYCFVVMGCVDFVQLLSFPFNDNSVFPWNAYYTAFFIKLANNSEEKIIMSDTNKLHNAIVYAISFSLVMLNLVVSSIVWYRFSKNQVQNPLMLKFVRTFCTAFATILYLPLLSQFALICACSLGYQQYLGCPDHLPWQFFVVSSLVLSLVLGMVSFVVVVSFYDQDPSSEEDAAKPHARLELFIIAAKAVFTMQFGLFGTPDYMVPCLITLLVLGSITCMLYILYIPMYSYVNAVRQAQYNTCFFWAVLCLGFCIIENNPDDGAPALLFYIGSVSIWVIAKFACEWRSSGLVKKTIENVKNPYEVELVTRFLLLSRFGTLNPEHLEGLEDYEPTLDYIEEFFFQAERKFPTSCILQLFIAQFYLTYRNSVPDSVVKMEKASNLHPFIDAQFVIYKRKENAKKHAGSDVVTFVTFNTYLQAAHRAEISAMRGQVQFWSELNSQEDPSISRMVDLSKVITSYMGEANQYYSLLMRMNPNHANLLHMYGFFLSDIKNDEKQSLNLHNRAEGLASGSKDKLKVAAEQFQESEGIRLVLSMDKGSFGRIEFASEEVLELLQVPKTFVVNESIDNFIPIQMLHDFHQLLKLSHEVMTRAGDEQTGVVMLLDGAGFLLLCKCILRPFLKKAASGLRESLSTKDVVTQLFSYQGKREEERQGEVDGLHMECQLVPLHDGECAMLVNMEGKVVYLSRAASLLTGITPDFNVKKSIYEIIFMYDRYFEEAMSYFHGTEPHSSNTFVVSSVGKFFRVAINISDCKLQRDTIILVKIRQLGDFDKKTQFFLEMFTIFLKAYFEKAQQMSFHDMKSIKVGSIFQREKNEASQALRLSKQNMYDTLFAKLQDKVAAANKEFSPELKKVSYVLLTSLALVGSLQVAGFVLVELLFAASLDDLLIIRTASNIQYYSLCISELTLILDFARQGIDVGKTADYYIQEMNITMVAFDDAVTKLQMSSHLSNLLNKDILILSQNAPGMQDYELLNSIESCIDQMTHGLALVEEGLPSYDISVNPHAFFVYENGRRGIERALRRISQEAVSDSHSQQTQFRTYLIVFTVFQCVVIIAGFFAHIPYALKIERVHIDVIGVFFAMPKNVVDYLLETAKSNLTLMQSEEYPSNKVKRMTEEGMDMEKRKLKTVRTPVKSDNSKERRKQLLTHANRLSRKLLLLWQNPLTLRVALCFLFFLAYILILETYLGQLQAYTSIESGPDLVQSIGLLKVFMLRASLAELGILYNRPGEDSPPAGNGTIYSTESLQEAKLECFNQSLHINEYLTLFRVGDSELSIPYDIIYEQQINHFFTQFFLDGCVAGSPGDCEGFHGGTLTQGLYGATRVFQADMEAIASL